ncbi:hypothetical protein CCR75_001135 [Bremia lactucae]|uniref:RING-type domain-containing protein n=1 Tax=Bremia lactucae TaxID=4779 RepID=A0A976P0C7_BRELC|nr:hypothetical protein CCR75_001135 [Bremia lactucae]
MARTFGTSSHSDDPASAYVSTVPPTSCLLCYNPNVDVILEPCHHQFHAACIDRVFTKDKVCPTCWNPIQAPRSAGNHQSYACTIPQDHSNTYAVDNGTTQARETPPDTSTDTSKLFKNPPVAMRKGKWTAEESAYCDRLIEEFKKGNLPLSEGTTLRTFLSKLLNCDPMRISKKYTGDQCIGKIIFRRREDTVNKDDRTSIRKELAELEKTYLEREQYNQRRREKRLESELSRDKNRFVPPRSIQYAGTGNVTPTTSSQAPAEPSQGFPSTCGSSLTTHESKSHATSANYSTRATPMLVQPPLHPTPQPNNAINASTHVLYTDHNIVSLHGIAGALSQGPSLMHQDEKLANNGTLETHSDDSFPRVSSIDSFSCLFPRVVSIENFQHTTSSGLGPMHSSLSYALPESFNSMSSSGFDAPFSGLPKMGSTTEGLNAYFPRIQSLEHLSSLLQGHGSNTGALPLRDSLEISTSKQFKKEPATTSGGLSIRHEETIMKEEPRQTETKARISSYSSSSTNDSVVLTIKTSSLTSDINKRLSPSHSACSSVGNQIQAPKPVNKMLRSSSGIFPRVPSMDTMPSGTLMDKIPRVASLDKLPRIPSMDKLHSLNCSEQRIPRVPSTDKLARVPSSDMLSRFNASDFSSFPSFTNLTSLSASTSYDKLSSLGGFKSGFPRNSSIEDILSLVASSESGLPSNGSALQLNALAAVAGEESSHYERKRRLDNSQQESSLSGDLKKSKVST